MIALEVPEVVSSGSGDTPGAATPRAIQRNARRAAGITGRGSRARRAAANEAAGVLNNRRAGSRQLANAAAQLNAILREAGIGGRGSRGGTSRARRG